MRTDGLRFGQLRPDGMDSNAFMYHLKHLLRDRYVEKVDDRYRLTHSGKTYVTSLSSTNTRPRLQPKLISILALTNESGQYLLAQRLEQPSLGTWMLPSGKQHFDESPEQHVVRESLEQFGADIVLSRRGLADIRISYDDQLVTHLIAHIYSGNYAGPVPDTTDRFVYAYHDVGELSDDQLTPGTRQICDALVGSSELFYLSLDV